MPDLSNATFLYIIVFLSILLILAIYYCIKFAIIIINFQESIENCLDEIDSQYNNISQILEIPIFYDSPEVKRVLSNLEDARNSLLYVANELTDNNVEDDTYKYEET